MKKSVVAFFILLLLVGAASAQQFSQKNALRGLSGVAVKVERLDAALEKDGVFRDQLQRDLELKFRQAGLRVNTTIKGDSFDYPQFYVNVHVIKDEAGFYAVNLTGRLIEMGEWRRGDILFVTTWQASELMIVGFSRLDAVRASLKDMVDTFLNDYLAANPK